MIIQGSNGVNLLVNIIEKGVPAPLSGSTVSVVIKAGPKRIVKTSTITGNGVVSTILSSDDLAYAGTYYVQAVVSYTDGRTFLSEVNTFMVGQML